MSSDSMDYPKINNTNYTYTNNTNNNSYNYTTSTQSSSSHLPPPNSSSATSSPLPRHTPKLTPPPPPPPPLREDCWSSDATFTLIEAWGQRYLHLNRGNLRQNHWRHVASVVNSLHPHPPRTHIQCKNRIDTVKKKYKIEKSRVSDSTYVSSCPFFYLLDSFIGHSFKSSSSSPLVAVSTRRNKLPALPLSVPVAPRSKRRVTGRVPVWINKSVEDDLGHGFRDMTEDEGYVIISEAIRRCGEIYKRVEEEKVRQMIELEKQRMVFAQELEIQRMKLLAESHIQLQRMSCPRHFIKQQR